MDELQTFKVKAPGRIFLFGEHSDYLSLEVISAALNLSIYFSVKERKDDHITLNYRDLNQKDSFKITDEVTYQEKRDYFRSSFNVLKKKNILLTKGADIEIYGDIPIAGGLSGSSAFSVASIIALTKLAKYDISKHDIAQYAFEAEVLEFKESGGKMDHLASTFGKIIHVDFAKQLKLTKLPAELDGIVIGDSLEKKQDTVGDIKLIRSTVESGYNRLSKFIDDFSHRKTDYSTIEKFIHNLDEPERSWTLATIKNRDLTRTALKLLSKSKPDPEIIGELLNDEHVILRDGLHRSTNKIEKMISAAKSAGAIGGKINGSGKGGTMLAYAPGNEKQVAKAIKEVGGKPYIITISDGASLII
ncbi:MAG: GHMP kinase [Asgard group archaeon]|nr:GHMP kinase [Asgard group archaeon]